VENIPEKRRAEIFAFRALAATGLMDPLSARTYSWLYAPDAIREDGQWRVGFAASDCAPRPTVLTCRLLSGKDPDRDSEVLDTFLIVALEDGTWRVADVQGNMLPEERDRIIGFSLADLPEPSHWEFPATAVGPVASDGTGWLSMWPIWVGPYPTDAPGSVCEVQLVDANGAPVGKPSIFYQEPPAGPLDLGGSVRGSDFENPDGVVDAVVECRPRAHTGSGWQVASEPVIERDEGEVMGVTFHIEWRGSRHFTTPGTCNLTLFNEADRVVWQGSKRIDHVGEWTKSDVPYRIFIVTAPGRHPHQNVAVDRLSEIPADRTSAVHVGAVGCSSQ
jgi:hypothetical protein